MIINRPRRLRKSANIRNLIAENTLTTRDLIYPLFIIEGKNKRQVVESMEGVFR
jgi:porphobilinogen synthase